MFCHFAEREKAGSIGLVQGYYTVKLELFPTTYSIIQIVHDMEKWPKSFSSTFQEKHKMDFQLRPFFHVSDDIIIILSVSSYESFHYLSR